MKVFIGGELEHSISDKFRKARNSVIEYMDCLCDISYINDSSFASDLGRRPGEV